MSVFCLIMIAVKRARIFLPEGERAVLYCDNTCGPIRRSLFTWFFNNELIERQPSSKARYFHSTAVSGSEVQLSLNRLFNPLDSKGNYSATSNNTKLVQWSLIGGLLRKRGHPFQLPIINTTLLKSTFINRCLFQFA